MRPPNPPWLGYVIPLVCLLMLACDDSEPFRRKTLIDGYEFERINVSGTSGIWPVGRGHVYLREVELRLAERSQWQDEDQALFYYTILAGDFEMKVLLTLGISGPNPVVCQDCFAGLMARSAEEIGAENHVWAAVSFGDTVAIETSTTRQSESTMQQSFPPDGDYELKISRAGDAVSFHSRRIGAVDWRLVASYDRGDFPEELQVGFNAYAYDAIPARNGWWVNFEDIDIVER